MATKAGSARRTQRSTIHQSTDTCSPVSRTWELLSLLLMRMRTYIQSIYEIIPSKDGSAISLAIHIVLIFVLLKVFNLGTYALVIGNVTFALTVCILNWISIGKLLNYSQEIKKTFLIPSLCSAIMGIVAYATYWGLYKYAIKINSLCTLIAILAAMAVYGCTLLLFKGITEEELYNIPGGRSLGGIAVKLHLLR